MVAVNNAAEAKTMAGLAGGEGGRGGGTDISGNTPAAIISEQVDRQTHGQTGDLTDASRIVVALDQSGND